MNISSRDLRRFSSLLFFLCKSFIFLAFWGHFLHFGTDWGVDVTGGVKLREDLSSTISASTFMGIMVVSSCTAVSRDVSSCTASPGTEETSAVDPASVDVESLILAVVVDFFLVFLVAAFTDHDDVSFITSLMV